MITNVTEIKTHIEMSANLAEFITTLTMYCAGYIITLGPYPEIEPDRVLLTVGYLNGPIIWGSEGNSPESAFDTLKQFLGGLSE